MGALKFRLFGFPVQVLPGFWGLLALLALWWRVDLAQGLVVAVVAFTSVLAHELGHALVARFYGLQPQITLHMMGGATAFGRGAQLSRRRDILITAAGPAAGLALGVVSLLLFLSRTPEGDFVMPTGGFMLGLLVSAQINLIWSVLNLVPVVPFDGGRILVAALGPARRNLAAAVSLGSGVLAGVLLYRLQQPIAAILIASSAVSSFMRMREAAKHAESPVDAQALEEALQAAEATIASHPERAETVAQAVLQSGATAALAKRAASLLAWARLARGDASGARQVIKGVGDKVLDPYLVASVHEATGHLEDARAVIVGARADGDERVELQALLVKVLLALKRLGPAAAVTRELVGAVPAAEVRRVAEEVAEGGQLAEASRLYLALAEGESTFDDARKALRLALKAGVAPEPSLAVATALDADRAAELAKEVRDAPAADTAQPTGAASATGASPAVAEGGVLAKQDDSKE